MNQSLFFNVVQQAMIFGVEAGVFGVEASTPPTPLDRTLNLMCVHVLNSQPLESNMHVL